MISHVVRHLIRMRFKVYAAYARNDRLRMLYNVWALGTPGTRRRVRAAAGETDVGNAILRRSSEYEETTRRLIHAGLVPHPDPWKNWDFWKAVAATIQNLDPGDPILDAGCGRFSPPLEWLEAAGFTNLTGRDYTLDHEGPVGRIRYDRGDLTQTPYQDASFQAILCLSVVEHNVPLPKFFAEMHRLLRPKGLLIVSTDFWPEKINTRGVKPYGDLVGETRIFDTLELEALAAMAQAAGFRLLGPLRTDAQDAPVHVHYIASPYTFVFFRFQKT